MITKGWGYFKTIDTEEYNGGKHFFYSYKF